MFNHLVLCANQAKQLDKLGKIELFLSFRNLERSSCVVNWSISLPAGVKATLSSKPLSGTTEILPGEQSIVLGGWILDVSPQAVVQEGEIEAAATLSVGGTDFKSDGTRASLSTLLNQV